MNKPDVKITRRRFLSTAAAALASAALACQQSGKSTQEPKQPPQPTSQPAPGKTPVITLTSEPAATINPSAAADLIFVNGKIFTVDANDAVAQAVAVKGNRILAVGQDGDIKALTGSATRVVNLYGRPLTPGLIDSHNHFQVTGMLNSYYIPFIPPDISTFDELAAKIEEFTLQMAPASWIQGYYLAFKEGRIPTRQEIDPVSPDHPVWIVQQGGHFGFANSAALKLAGITASTPNPDGGIIERSADGEPTGIFYNHRAMDLLRRVIPPYPIESSRENIRSLQPVFAAMGVTSFHDNNVRDIDVIRLYEEAGQQGAMSLRAHIYYTLEWPKDLERALNEVPRYEDPFMHFAGFKFLIDGQAPTAFCHQPHNGVSWNMPTWEAQDFKDTVRALHDTGLQICVHCAGDAAVDLALDAFEGAMNANPRPDPRHRIEHCILSTPQATRRMKDLGVVVSTQPHFIYVGGETWISVFGEERSDRIIVTREWLENGIPLALGSDAPTVPWYTPSTVLAGAVFRQSFRENILSPEQCLTFKEALRAHTLGSAYATFKESELGSIEPGKLADLVAWRDDISEAPDMISMYKARVAMTVVDGKVVYEAV